MFFSQRKFANKNDGDGFNIFASNRRFWRLHIAELKTNSGAFFSSSNKDYTRFNSFRTFLLNTKPVVTDQMNEEMIKPAEHLSRQSLANIDTLTWKLVGLFNKRITFRLVEHFQDREKMELFTKYSDPFRHSKKKIPRPFALVSLGPNNEKNEHSKFFPKWSQEQWGRMRKILRYGISRA